MALILFYCNHPYLCLCFQVDHYLFYYFMYVCMYVYIYVYIYIYIYIHIYIFWPCHKAYGILAPGPGIKRTPAAVETWNFHHYFVREIPRLLFLMDRKYVFYCLKSTEPSTNSIPFMNVQWMNEYTSVWIVSIYHDLAQHTFISLSVCFRLYPSLWFN